MSDVNRSKVLSCVFWNDIWCLYRKAESFGVMERCYECRHYERFMRAMALEDEKERDEIEEMEELHVGYLSGEISEEELRKRFFSYRHGELE